VLSTLYHLSRFLVQNAEFDNFNPKTHTLKWAEAEKQLRPADLWLMSKLQETVEECTVRLETCEFNFALATLEDFVIETLSRLYVPMIRKELWTDDPETLNRRLAVYATLWHVLKTVTLLFNPVTPYLSEALYQKVYRKLDPTMPESVNFESWPKTDEKMRSKDLEEDFQTLFKCVSLVYSARQSGKLKRRWPLRKVVVVAPEKVRAIMKNVEELFLELANVKTVECAHEASKYTSQEGWVSATEDNMQVFLDVHRDEGLVGEGLMRDLARRVQTLRKELGYVPTDVLEVVYVAELDSESIRLLKPYLKEMEELVRAKNVKLQESHEEVGVDWHEYQLDDRKVYIAIPQQVSR
jgi:isoleucyl-tRNA synthetase